MSIHKSTICRILKKEYGKPSKIKKVFYLNEGQKLERVEFSKKILKTRIIGGQILFTYETKIKLLAFINDFI